MMRLKRQAPHKYKPRDTRQREEKLPVQRCVAAACLEKGHVAEIPVCKPHWDLLEERVRQIVWDDFKPGRHMARDVRAYVTKVLASG